MQLGDARSDVISYLSVFVPAAKAAQMVDSASAYVRGEAKAGAEAAIPEIETKVRDTVKPYVIAAVIAGGLGALVGVIAIVAASRSKHP
jgi:hypothetical protein